ncbi:MAG: hypothetical protein ACYTGC_02155 [Planctomycetota bacterium]|jgi:hypothetical protein
MTDSAETNPFESSPHGVVVDDRDDAELRRAIEAAFDYRGDVTIHRRSTSDVIEGYLFDRRTERVQDDAVRLIERETGSRVTIVIADITRLSFTGRDTAAGKSFETWMRKYVQKKLAGETASIEADPLLDD